MSLPDDESPAKTQEAAPSPVLPVSLTPDRRRIDSDVRAFLRQPSTPWIVFDKDGDVPPADAPVLTSGTSSILASHGVFPSAPGASAAPDPKAEPSSVAVASDLASEPSLERDPFADTGESASFAAVPVKRLDPRVLIGASAAFAVTLAGAIVFAFASGGAEAARSHRAPPAAFAAQAVQADAPPPDLAATPTSLPTTATATASTASTASSAAAASGVSATGNAPTDAATTSTPATSSPGAPAAAKPAREQYGRLSIAGKARGMHVFLDGKRLLGKGARSFVIVCGRHQIAVGERTDVRDVDVPCNQEMILTQ